MYIHIYIYICICKQNISSYCNILELCSIQLRKRSLLHQLLHVDEAKHRSNLP